jgi:type II secretory ATPase GspE/PulE/Tfp pilus assembly ATPase PilB-like protein
LSRGVTQTHEELRLVPALTRDYLLHHRICPSRVDDDGSLVFAIGQGAHVEDLNEIATIYAATALRTETVEDAALDKLIESVCTRSDRAIELQRASTESDELTADVRSLADQPPVIRYVNLLVGEAYDSSASDIHLEATRDGLDARFRIDGVLVAAPEPPAELHQAVVSRIKLLAELNIAERRQPQDGRIRVHLGSRELDLRVSTVPTMHGESVVLRLLDRGGRPIALDELGMPATIHEMVKQLAQRPHGMLLVTGPTGSGKTTTLYSALQLREARREKIITVEDPIEYQITGITQVPAHRQAGVSFAKALRAILRQDPDVVMIGEMRDQETAEIAVQAAMTGHLVFSTLHTNDAISAIPRLFDLGVPDYLVSATLEGVLAQRLVRKNCDACVTEYHPPPARVAALAARPVGRARLLHGAGCKACRGTGFKGRIGIFELLTMSDELREAIARRAPRAEFRAIAEAGGFAQLHADGWDKVVAGMTTVEEVLRVVQN